MDIIIPNLKRYSDGEIDRAFMKEIQNGFNLEKKRKKRGLLKQPKKPNTKGDYTQSLANQLQLFPQENFPTHTEVRSRDCAF